MPYKIIIRSSLSRICRFFISQFFSLKFTCLFFSPPGFLSNLLLWSSQWIVFISHGNNSCRRSQPLFGHSSLPGGDMKQLGTCEQLVNQVFFFFSVTQCFVAGLLRALTIWSVLSTRDYVYATGLIVWWVYISSSIVDQYILDSIKKDLWSRSKSHPFYWTPFKTL